MLATVEGRTMTTVAHILRAKPNKSTFTIAPAASVFDAVRQMAQRDVGALVVTDGATVVGLVTERDYARKVVLLDRASRDTAVHEIMMTPIMYVGLKQTVEECMALMTDKRVRHLPVLEDGELMGVVSIGDLVKQVIADQRFTIEQLEHFISGHPA
jgi:CBS domain-containing protein